MKALNLSSSTALIRPKLCDGAFNKYKTIQYRSSAAGYNTTRISHPVTVYSHRADGLPGNYMYKKSTHTIASATSHNMRHELWHDIWHDIWHDVWYDVLCDILYGILNDICHMIWHAIELLHTMWYAIIQATSDIFFTCKSPITRPTRTDWKKDFFETKRKNVYWV